MGKCVQNTKITLTITENGGILKVTKYIPNFQRNGNNSVTINSIRLQVIKMIILFVLVLITTVCIKMLIKSISEAKAKITSVGNVDVTDRTSLIRFKIIVLCIIGFITIVYFAMFLSTVSVAKDVENVILGNVSKEETKGTPLNQYNDRRSPDSIIESSVIPVFSIHNFFDGYMFVRVRYQEKDEQGKLLRGSGPSIERWKIHRNNREWTVVEVKSGKALMREYGW